MTQHHAGHHAGKSHDDAVKGKPPYRDLLDEADIGSGERTPGQEETDRIVREVKPTGKAADSAKKDAAPGDQAAADGKQPDSTSPDDSPPDPEAEQIGLADDLADDVADDGATEPEPAETSEFAVETSAHDQRISIEQDEPDSLLNDLDPVPPKGN